MRSPSLALALGLLLGAHAHASEAWRIYLPRHCPVAYEPGSRSPWAALHTLLSGEWREVPPEATFNLPLAFRAEARTFTLVEVRTVETDRGSARVVLGSAPQLSPRAGSPGLLGFGHPPAASGRIEALAIRDQDLAWLRQRVRNELEASIRREALRSFLARSPHAAPAHARSLLVSDLLFHMLDGGIRDATGLREAADSFLAGTRKLRGVVGTMDPADRIRARQAIEAIELAGGVGEEIGDQAARDVARAIGEGAPLRPSL